MLYFNFLAAANAINDYNIHYVVTEDALPPPSKPPYHILPATSDYTRKNAANDCDDAMIDDDIKTKADNNDNSLKHYNSDTDMPREADNGVTACKDNNDAQYSTTAADKNDVTNADIMATTPAKNKAARTMNLPPLSLTDFALTAYDDDDKATNEDVMMTAADTNNGDNVTNNKVTTKTAASNDNNGTDDTFSTSIPCEHVTSVNSEDVYSDNNSGKYNGNTDTQDISVATTRCF